MLTPSGAPGSGSAPHLQNAISGLSWMSGSEPLNFPPRMTNDTAAVASTNSATPRRYTPPSPNANDLNEFFGPPTGEWHGVKVQRLACTTTKNEVKTMFLFSAGLEDVRVIKGDQAIKDPNCAEAYVRFKAREYAEEAERFINDREMNGTKLVVTVVPRPTLSEIIKMAASMEMFSPDFNISSSQSPSSSDGLATPAATSTASLSEYTTASSRHIGSPPNGPGLINGTNGLTRLDTALGGLPSGLNGSRMNGTAGHIGSEPDLPPLSAFDRLTLDTNGISSTTGYDSNFMETPTLLGTNRGMGPFHDPSIDSSDNTPVADAFSPVEPLSAFPRPRRQTTAGPGGSTSRFGSLPPLSTSVTNSFNAASMSPLTAPPIGAPQLNSPLSLNSPAGWSTTTTKPFYPNFSITSHPPANPADQNPPCNTLYVGNLPAQTSEDELKALFCRQRGYKRMCFRTKPQGPMCFVEFEDTHYATKALTELYGRALSNSTKGGVRLSFSKNPLGVRSQNNPSSPVTKPPNAFPTPIRTPPGLTTTPTTTAPPPGLFTNRGRGASGLGGTPTTRLPPGITPTTTVSSSGGFFSDVRSPIVGPGPIGTIGNPR